MSESVLIRIARPSEDACLSAIAVRSKAYWGYSKKFLEACRDELTVSSDRLSNGQYCCFVAEVSGELVGFYGIESIAERLFELEGLFVAPEHIGKGIGRVLIQHAIKTAAANGGTKLLIQSDPNAEPFYRAVGGIRVGSRESDSIPGRLLPVIEIAVEPY